MVSIDVVSNEKQIWQAWSWLKINLLHTMVHHTFAMVGHDLTSQIEKIAMDSLYVPGNPLFEPKNINKKKPRRRSRVLLEGHTPEVLEIWQCNQS